MPHHDERQRRRPRIAATGRGRSGGRAAARRRPRLDGCALEDRRLLTTFVVNDPADTLTDGAPTMHTLRWAVAQADAATRPSTIRFELVGDTRPATITLTQGVLDLTNTAAPVTIEGPGSDRLTIDGNSASGIFKVEPGVQASLSGCTLADGKAVFGGAINNSGALSLSGCVLENNHTRGALVRYGGLTTVTAGAGGAIDNGRSGTLSLTGCTLTGNNATNGAGDGGAIHNQGTAT